MKRPRVSVTEHIEPNEFGNFGDGVFCVTPGVEVLVDFDLHDHEQALALLDRAVARVKAQIAEAS